MRHDLPLRDAGPVLVRGGTPPPADADRRRRLLVPRLPAPGGGAGRRQGPLDCVCPSFEGVRTVPLAPDGDVTRWNRPSPAAALKPLVAGVLPTAWSCKSK